jgi:hypothetical protein
MVVLNDDEKQLCAQVARQFPRFGELLDKTRQAELEIMAKTTQELFCTHKGRVQMLTELRQLISAR